MRTIFSTSITLLASLFLFSCHSDKTKEITDDKTYNQGLDKTWAKNFLDSMNAKATAFVSAGDSVGLASFYWPDAQMLMANSEPVSGKDLVPVWGSLIRMGIKEFTFNTTDISGDYKYMIETGNYEMKDAKKTLIDRGKYVVVWEQREGVWKLYRDIGNTSLPLPK